jgi:RNA polymerase sigma-70 factor (ECF subfamily)
MVATRLASLIAGPSDAEDATQDAFIKAFYALPRFRQGAPFRPWLLRIVGNEARNRVRARGRQWRVAGRVALARADAAPTAEDEVIAIERRGLLVDAINSLAERDRLVLACRFLAEMTERETAEALDCAIGTVKSRTARALARLEVSLGRDPAELRDA